jgi:hypothetical protein
MQETETRYMSVTIYNINSEWIKDFHIKPETRKLVQERAGNALSNDFLNRNQMTQQLRERIEKWDYMKLKSFCTTKERVSKLKKLHTDWEEICVTHLTRD